MGIGVLIPRQAWPNHKRVITVVVVINVLNHNTVVVIAVTIIRIDPNLANTKA